MKTHYLSLNFVSINLLLYFLCFALCFQANAQSITSLRKKIEHIIKKKDAVIGVSIMGIEASDTLSILGDRQFPMQSVFKFHIGLAMMSEIDKGNFSLDQKVKIEKHELLPGFWSPIREKFPEGASLTISELLKYTVSQSDNVGCDVLLRLLGGAQQVETFIKKHGVSDISIQINEEVMQSNWDLQFLNWTTPKAASEVLAKFFYNKNLLSPESYDFIWKIMQETTTGPKRLRGKLPEGTLVAHKTGWSGKNKTTGVTAAINDIGIVYLPNGAHFVISIFMTDSKEDTASSEEAIAKIAKASWDFFCRKIK